MTSAKLSAEDQQISPVTPRKGNRSSISRTKTGDGARGFGLGVERWRFTARRCTARHRAPRTFLIAPPISAGLLTTVTPAAARAAIFSDAVPFPPAMIAPA